MKKLFTFLALCWLCGRAPVQAQAPPTDSLRQQLDRLFAPVDKTQVPAPFLEEYGRHFLPLDVFNGALSDSNRTNTDVWRQAFATLATSRIHGTGTLPRLDSLAARRPGRGPAGGPKGN